MRKARFRIDYKYAGMTHDGPIIQTILIPKNFKAYKIAWNVKVNHMLNTIVDSYVVVVMLEEFTIKHKELYNLPKLKNKPI